VWGGGVPSPLKNGSGEGAVPPPQKFLNFFGSMCSKKFCVQAKGGGAIAQWPPPLNTPLAGIYFVLARACGQLNFLLSSGSKLEVPANGHKTVVVVTTTKLKITA